MLASFFELVPQAASSSSVQSSLSSSRSRTKSVSIPGTMSSGLPSSSVSIQAAGSFGNASGPAVQTPIGIAGASGPSQIPSPSVSALLNSEVEFASCSVTLDNPSPSTSSSCASQIPSPSKSLVGVDEAFNGSESQLSSEMSLKPSPSSSRSSSKLPT